VCGRDRTCGAHLVLPPLLPARFAAHELGDRIRPVIARTRRAARGLNGEKKP
jgi:hypothetical protein